MLDVRGLDTYYGLAHILAGVELSAGRGEVVVLLGRNGAGKTTTLKTIMGLIKPAAGRIAFAGEDIIGLPPHRIAQRGLGYVPEDRRIFAELTVLENLEVGRQPPRAGASAWTLARLFAIFPNLAEMKTRLGGRMSGGEQQMLTIARTLMGNPVAVLLDEPSEGLAPVIVEQLARAIAELRAGGLTVVLAEQNLRFAARVADRAYIIEKGRIRYHGTMAALAADEAVRSQYLTV
ncbi:MAG: ABC transporter ATP-binding protein [Pseudomonadota bacterium]